MITIALPLILFLIMISMGMELTLDDFKRVAAMPRAACVGLAGQMLLLPAVALAFAHWPGFDPMISLGIVIVAACPGGATSNLFSYLARANVALSITLTSLSSTLCFLTIPFWIDLGIRLFIDPSGASEPIELPLGRAVAQLFGVTLVPVAIGMATRARWPEQSARVRGRLRRVMSAVMAVTIVIVIATQWETVAHNLDAAAAGAFGLITGMLALAWTIARVCRLDARDAFTISIEVGLQNGALASTIVLSLLGRPELMVFPGAYLVISFVPVSAWTAFMRTRFTADADATSRA